VKVCNALLILLLLAGCTGGTGGPDLNPEQEGVYRAMRQWCDRLAGKDHDGLWEMLSADAQDIYRRELEAPGGVRSQAKLLHAGLEPGGVTSEAEKNRMREGLKELPPEPEKLTAKDYYKWRIAKEATPEAIANTSRLFASDNLVSIKVEGDNATVTLKHGDPKTYSWIRHGGVWKIDLKPSILRALDDARRRESGK
jgi:hypothetical protein